MATPLLPVQGAAPIPESASVNKQADAPETPFNQVLSREMADKQPTQQADSGSRPSNSGSKAPDQPAPAKTAGNNTQKTENSGSGKTDKADKSDKTDDAAQDDTQQDPALSGAMATSAEMMALIANAAKAAPKPDDKSAALAESGVVDATKLTKDMLLGQAGKAGKTDADGKLAALGTGKATAKAGVKAEDVLGKADDAGRGKDFTEQMKLAEEAKDGKNAAAGKPGQGDAAKGIAERLAATETVKSTELAAPQATSATAAVTQQTAALQAAQLGPVAGADHLAPRVGAPGWDTALSQKVVWMVAGEQQSASLTLNPPDLGPVQVVLNVSNSMANATFITAQPEVKQAIENALPKLREMMGDAGIQLGQATVNTGMPNQHQAQRDNNWASANSGSGSRTSASDGLEAALPLSRATVTSSGQGLVDTFV